MESAIVKKRCAKCTKGAALATCNGCQQLLCSRHFGEHREELSHEMDNVGQEHDLLQQDLDQQNAEHPLFLQINTWEREAVTKIQVTAEAARADLLELLDRNKKELKTSVTKITSELQSCREADDYTEIDINKWTQQLQALRKTLESPSTIPINEIETPESIIRLIRVRDQQQYHFSEIVAESFQYRSSANERFDRVLADAIVSEEGLVVTYAVDSWLLRATIYGGNQYSSETHRVHFRIEKIGNSRRFFSISASYEKMRRGDVRNIFLCGWWGLNQVIANGVPVKSKGNKMVTTGDEMTLTLDCDNRQIQLLHHQTNRLVQLVIDLNKMFISLESSFQISSARRFYSHSSIKCIVLYDMAISERMTS